MDWMIIEAGDFKLRVGRGLAPAVITNSMTEITEIFPTIRFTQSICRSLIASILIEFLLYYRKEQHKTGEE